MSFNSLLINKAKIKSVVHGDWNEPTETVGPELPCRIEYNTKRITDYKGEEKIAGASIFFKIAHMTFNNNDKILLDVENYEVDHSILLISRLQNSSLAHHGEVWIGYYGNI